MKPLPRGLLVGAAVPAFVLVACWLYIFLVRPHITSETSPAPLSSASTSSAAVSPQLPLNWAQYASSLYDFTLGYPDSLAVSQHPGAGNTMVVLFQNEATQQGFQIFITPYNQQKITQQRFLMDEPSGVMDDPQNITIDGAPATEFFSTNLTMGASCEIWFLHNSFLYEVTAPKALASWLIQIMETWEFT